MLQLDAELERRIEDFAQSTGMSATEVIQAAFEAYAVQQRPLETESIPEGETLYDRLLRSGLIGCVDDAPPDLSTNKAYMEGFGRD